MVGPIYIFVVALFVAFLTPFFDKISRKMAITMLLFALGFMTYVAGSWLYQFIGGAQTTMIYTAGFKPPVSISLQLGFNESVFILMINVVAFFTGIYLLDYFKKMSVYSIALFLLMVMGLNGMVMTRDFFNLFVFSEIASIATYSLIAFEKNLKSFTAGFKYLIAGSIASSLFLVGVIYLYRITGTLNIDTMIASSSLLVGKGSFVAIFLLFIALIIELKPFPANGWAIDVYEAVNPGIAAMISGAVVAASYFVLAKALPAFGPEWYSVVAWIGIITFVGSNLLGIKQEKSRRLLGYSSLGQVGLLMVILGFSDILGEKRDFIAFAMIISHFFAKAGLFWIAGIIKKDNMKDWSILRRKPMLLVLFGTFIFALIGFPPFPSFFGKWELIMGFMKNGLYLWVAFILLSSFFEGLYLFRWFGYALKLDDNDVKELTVGASKFIPTLVFGVALYGFGYYMGTFVDSAKNLNYIPLIFIAFIGLIDVFPAWIKNTFSIAGVVAYSYMIYPNFQDDFLKMIFLFIFLGGAVITLFGGYYAKGRRAGFHAMALTMFAGLLMLVEASNLMQLFYGWELMSIGSYFLLIRGKKSMPHGLSYMLFSLGGAYAIMYGFGLAYAGSGTFDLIALKNISIFPALAYSLMLIGFMTKTASIGLHVWLPGAHGEAVADIHFMASAILLKAGVYGIIIVLLAMGTETSYAKTILYVLGWVGAISALVGNLTAVFQESAKRLLAWSSIGQIGYIIFALASMSYIGWVGGLFYTIAHFLYKGILFSVIGGIALKLGTAYMYKMGGLIKRMPFSFVAVLMAIITLAGIPPLMGFTGKWLFYNIILTKELFFQGIIVMVSGMIAFLYLYRLIDTIFLGQLKDEHRNVKEISVALLIPVYAMLGVIMYFSIFPTKLLKPLSQLAQKYFPENAMTFANGTAITKFGYFNGTSIFIVVMVIFAVVVSWLAYKTRGFHTVKQFNIVYSGESPDRPETTHFAWNFLAGYRKGLGFIVEPYFDRFWDWISDAVHGIADQARRIYTGNGQTYALQIIVYTVVVYFFVNGGF